MLVALVEDQQIFVLPPLFTVVGEAVILQVGAGGGEGGGGGVGGPSPPPPPPLQHALATGAVRLRSECVVMFPSCGNTAKSITATAAIANVVSPIHLTDIYFFMIM
jgi:hypothetical protein